MSLLNARLELSGSKQIRKINSKKVENDHGSLSEILRNKKNITVLFKENYALTLCKVGVCRY